MKTITRSLPWTQKTQWAWPENDEKLILVFDQVSDIDLTMKYVEEPKVCIQAGGAAGIWPLRYSMLFDQVITFEPMPENRECLLDNIKDSHNIVVYPYALSDKVTDGEMLFDKTEKDNYGAAYFSEKENGDIHTSTIDSIGVDRCDMIQLDIEGYELEALKGAINTIQNYKPVIVLEEKKLPQFQRDYLLPRKYLEQLGYKEVDRVHRDVIFT